uniref:AAA family ATPase n=1 Tax=Dendronalium phyllosphericum TaxID=2840445 RepID=UPI00384BBDC9
MTATPLAPTEEENRRWRYNRLLKELQHIYLKISDPGEKLYALQELANRTPGRRPKDLENLYMKSLCATVEPRISLDQLESEIGSQGRKWLLGGILPEATTTLVYADGGVGKTKWLYDLLYCLTTGQNWNGFPATADNRRVLIYQGDESKHDMLQALNKRGFTPGTEARQRTQVRFGWNTDAIPILYRDIEEFDPAIIMIDSLTFVNRYSIYDENSTEYSRAVLELNQVVAETGKNIVIIHHANRQGQARGATSIKNAVSEVVKLERDTSPQANVQEKILTIEKSRSRRFPASYRLFFNEEDFSFSVLEEVGQEMGSPDTSTRQRIVEFLQQKANIKFEAEEIARHIGSSGSNTRRCCYQLARDGIIIVDERSNSGTRKLYYITRESENCSIYTPLQSESTTSSAWITSENTQDNSHQSDTSENNNVYQNTRSPGDHHPITLGDHLLNNSESHTQQELSRECNEGDRLSMPKIEFLENSESEKKSQENDDRPITFAQNDCTVSVLEGDRPRRSGGDRVALEGDQLEGDRLEPVVQAPQPKHSSTKPRITVGAVFWSRSLAKRVKVTKVYPSVKKVDVVLPNDFESKPRLPWHDLADWRDEVWLGDEVEVLQGEHRGQVLIVDCIHEGGIWLKKPSKARFSPPLCNNGVPYQLEHLKKVGQTL